MADFLLALAFLLTVLLGLWIASRLDRFPDKRKGGGKGMK